MSGPNPPADTAATRLATRLAFLAAGVGMACWAPLIPYAKARAGLDDAGLGSLLLCLGLGSVASMVLAGGGCHRYGSRPFILLAGIAMAALLPVLASVSTWVLLAVALTLFGASLGVIDVAMNVHAVRVERDSESPLMSGFHGLFSVGGFAGAGAMTGLLGCGLSPVSAVGIVAAAIVGTVVLAFPLLLKGGDGEGRGAEGSFVFPKGMVLFLGVLAFAMFLLEGAVLDWSATLLTESKGLPTARGGLGYAVFSVAMTAGRLSGDRVVAVLGGARTLLWGGTVAVVGLLLAVWSPGATASLAGFFLIGIGASNLVPVVFSAVGRQTAMPTSFAIGAVTMIGYAGILAGPAALGFLSRATSLPTAFLCLAAFFLAVPLSWRIVGRLTKS